MVDDDVVCHGVDTQQKWTLYHLFQTFFKQVPNHKTCFKLEMWVNFVLQDVLGIKPFFLFTNLCKSETWTFLHFHHHNSRNWQRNYSARTNLWDIYEITVKLCDLFLKDTKICTKIRELEENLKEMKRNVGELKRVTEDYVKREVDRALDYYMILYVSLKEKNHGTHGAEECFQIHYRGRGPMTQHIQQFCHYFFVQHKYFEKQMRSFQE